MKPDEWDVEAIRSHFVFPQAGRIVTNNAASTQPPRELLALLESLAPDYENVHRGQSSASQAMTRRFEDAYDQIARFVNAPGRNNIVVCRNTTEAHNTVMYSLLTAFRDGDNVVTTMMEHNSNYVPWYAMCKDILPKFGRRVEYRLVRFDPRSGELDLEHMASLVDSRTKLVCCTGASNFFGTKTPLAAVRALADASGYVQPDGERRSYLLVDGAQLVPGTFVDVQQLDIDYLSFSFHKMLAPFGVGVLYAKKHLLESSLPFLYGGDMIAEGQVFPDSVGYNALPWKYESCPTRCEPGAGRVIPVRNEPGGGLGLAIRRLGGSPPARYVDHRTDGDRHERSAGAHLGAGASGAGGHGVAGVPAG